LTATTPAGALGANLPTTRRRNPHRFPKPDRRRALELLAGCGDEGCTKAKYQWK
jgi:hypothetical protein